MGNFFYHPQVLFLIAVGFHEMSKELDYVAKLQHVTEEQLFFFFVNNQVLVINGILIGLGRMGIDTGKVKDVFCYIAHIVTVKK